MDGRWYARLWVVVLVGAALRLVAAHGYGLWASDDYRYVIEPAWRWLSDPGAPYPSDYRSPLVAWAVFGIMRLAHALGIVDPAERLRLVYAGFGAWSLLAIPGTYLLVRRRLGESAALTAAWLVAGLGLMPRLATRALIEVVAQVPLVWGLWSLTEVVEERAVVPSRARLVAQALAAGALLGFAAMLRFQVGVLVPLLLGYVLWRDRWRLTPALGGLIAGLGVAFVAQAAIDLATQGRLLAAPLAYLAFNLEHSSKFGTSAWYTYLGFFVALTAPPLTLWLWRPLVAAGRAQPLVVLALLGFVLAHSLVGHKEERFMFTMLPLFCALLGPALLAAPRRVALGFVAVNTVALVVALLSDGQRGLIDPLLEVGRGEVAVEQVVLVDEKRKRVPEYYLAGKARFARVRTYEQAGGMAGPTRFIAAAPPPAELGAGCGPPRYSHGDAVDRVLVWLRPRENRRRDGWVVTDCSRK